MREVSFFGKVPSEGDFLRAPSKSAAAIAFENWTHEAYGSLRGAGLAGVPAPVYCVVPDQASGCFVYAAMVPSVDSVGRAFPFVVTCTVPAAEVAVRASVLPIACDRFFNDVATLGEQLDGLDRDSIIRRVASIAPVSASEEQYADTVCDRTSSSVFTAEFETTNFHSAAERYYAYRTLRLAGVSKQGGITLDCPLNRDVDLFVWAEIIHAVRLWRAAPMVWTIDPEPRLLVSLGAQPTSAVRQLFRADARDASYWNLKTDNATALEEASNVMARLAAWDRVGEPISMLIERVASLPL
ncbi:MAG: type VI secretion system-associated protein TagF [Myxococcales bacterium]|nr:type VI secretion system-associated protein TagF [Myxococcales bacterium]